MHSAGNRANRLHDTRQCTTRFFRRSEEQMKRITDDVEFYRLREAGTGWIYSEHIGAPSAWGSIYNILHSSSCSTLKWAGTDYPKYFFSSLSEAETWLRENRGIEEETWKRCLRCAHLMRHADV